MAKGGLLKSLASAAVCVCEKKKEAYQFCSVVVDVRESQSGK
jgi:hypothetical protein